MSENEEIMNETENETMAAEVEAVETVETEAAEVEAADEVFAEEEAEVVEAAVDYDDEELMDKMQKAARLLRSRRFAISKEGPSAWRTSSAPSSSLTSSPRWSRRKCPTCWACAFVSSMA